MAHSEPFENDFDKFLAESDLDLGKSTPSSNTLNKLQAAMRDQTASTAASVEALETAVTESSAATKVIEESIIAIGTAQRTVKTVQLNEDMRVQNTTIEAFDALGGQEFQVALLEELQSDAALTNELLDRRIDISDDKFTRIPLIDNIINDFRSLQLDTQIKAASRKERHTANELATIAASTESVARTAALTKHTLNSGVIEANLAGMEAQTSKELSEQELQNIHSNAQMVTTVFNMRGQEVSTLLSQFRLEGEAESRELARARNKFAIEELQFRRDNLASDKVRRSTELELTQLRLKEAKDPVRIAALESVRATQIKAFNDTIATENQLVQAVQRGQSASGVAIETRELILNGLSRTGDTGKKYKALQDIGASAQATLGADPWSARATLETVSPSGNFIRTKATDLLDQITILQSAKYAAPNSTGAPSSEAARESDYNNTARELALTNAADIKTGDSSNPYHAPPMAAIKDMRAVRESIAYKKVFEPLGFQEIDPQKFMDAAVNGIQSGAVTAEEAAAGVETIFEAAAAYNNTMTGGFNRIGFPSQRTYNTQLRRAPTGFETLLSQPSPAGVLADVAKDILRGDPEGSSLAARFQARLFPVDMMDRTQVQQAIVRLLAVAKPLDESQVTQNLEQQNAE